MRVFVLNDKGFYEDSSISVNKSFLEGVPTVTYEGVTGKVLFTVVDFDNYNVSYTVNNRGAKVLEEASLINPKDIVVNNVVIVEGE